MNELVLRSCVIRFKFGDAVFDIDAFHRNDAVGVFRHDGARHDLYAMAAVLQRLHSITGRLRRLNNELAGTVR